MEKQKNIRLGLWLKHDQEGGSYMSGNFTYGSKVFIRKNSYKKTEKDPDYFLTFVPTEKEDEAALKQKSESVFDGF